MSNMIWVTGDTHRDWVHRLNMESFPEQKEMTKDDYVIVLGDFGIWNDTPQQRHTNMAVSDKDICLYEHIVRVA